MNNKTKELQGIVQNRILAAGYTAYADEAPDEAAFPRIVYSLGATNYVDIRDDIALEVDIWDKSPNYESCELIADALEAEIPGVVHIPDSIVLPEFFRYLRNKIPDPDKKLKRINLKFTIQNYPHTKEANNG